MILLSFLAAVAAGQPTAFSESTARSAMSVFADCMVNISGFRIRPVLDRPVGELGEAAAWSPLMSEQCVTPVANKQDSDVELRFKRSVMRGAFYESFYKAEFKNKSPTESFEGTVVRNAAIPDKSMAGSFGATYRLMMYVGECAVRQAPLSARALVLSEIEKPSEMTAIREIIPAISACVPDGAQLTFSKTVIRGMIAESLYRLSIAKRDAG